MLDLARSIILLMLATFLAMFTGWVWASLVYGSDSASFKFDPQSNDGVIGFMAWLGVEKLTEEKVEAYFDEQGVAGAIIAGALRDAPNKCGESSDFLGFFRHPTEPGVKILCNGAPRDAAGNRRGFTPEEVANICRIWDLEFVGWFPGSPHRPPELECARPAKAKPSSTPRGHLMPGEEIAIDTSDPESIRAFNAAIGAVSFVHPRDAEFKAKCESQRGWRYMGSWRSPTGLEGSFCANPLPAHESWASDLCRYYAGLTFRRVDPEHPAVVVCARSTYGAAYMISTEERNQELYSPDGFPMTNIVVRWEMKAMPENTSEGGFAELWKTWESDCRKIGGDFTGITTNFELGTHTGYCNVPKIREM